MKITSWNVNSIKARLEHAQRYLNEYQPDVLMLQELKGLEFPSESFSALGYHVATVPQKAYNGVAILSKTPITIVAERLDGDETDEQARYLEVDVGGLRMIDIYLPNGNPVETEKFSYKLSWMERLHTRLFNLRRERRPFLIGGDFNVIPEDKDCHDPKAWEGDALFCPETRAAFRKLLHMGLYDAFRIYNNAPHQFTFWDYQAGAWQNDKGIRIDHFLLSPEIADRLTGCTIEKAPRGWDKPSDHTPITIEIRP